MRLSRTADCAIGSSGSRSLRIVVRVDLASGAQARVERAGDGCRVVIVGRLTREVEVGADWLRQDLACAGASVGGIAANLGEGVDAFLELQEEFRQIALELADFEEERKILSENGNL